MSKFGNKGAVPLQTCRGEKPDEGPYHGILLQPYFSYMCRNRPSQQYGFAWAVHEADEMGFCVNVHAVKCKVVD